MWCMIQKQAKTIEELEGRLEEVEQKQSRAQRNRKEIISQANELDQKVAAARKLPTRLRRSSRAQAQPLNRRSLLLRLVKLLSIAKTLLGGVEPSSSPLNFFARSSEVDCWSGRAGAVKA